MIRRHTRKKAGHQRLQGSCHDEQQAGALGYFHQAKKQ